MEQRRRRCDQVFETARQFDRIRNIWHGGDLPPEICGLGNSNICDTNDANHTVTLRDSVISGNELTARRIVRSAARQLCSSALAPARWTLRTEIKPARLPPLGAQRSKLAR
ncbi:hypothetical protein [Burkholderia ubonensis]|uniref:hypothetical protein n=1 Tax=Burkholderia ubonensis TaxID=101571 RepID=UPI0012F9E728|nr:hypothetical protein [Burkholderia ubonensis]